MLFRVVQVLIFFLSAYSIESGKPKSRNKPFLLPKDIIKAYHDIENHADKNYDLRPSKYKSNSIHSYTPDDQMMGKWRDEARESQDFPTQEEDEFEKLSDFVWHNSIIPYKFMSTNFSKEFLSLFSAQIARFMTYTCVRFIPYNPKVHSRHLVICNTSIKKCSANVGPNANSPDGQPQMTINDPVCRSSKQIAHELMHVLGFRHEHQRDDRDNYVKILYENIDSQFIDEFRKGRSFADSFNYTKYDIKSVLHYPSFSHVSKDRLGKPTILARNAMWFINENEITEMDYKRVNLHYNCAEKKQQQSYGLQAKNYNSNYRQKVECQDRNEHCKAWAKDGDCKMKVGKDSVLNWCPKSCKKC